MILIPILLVAVAFVAFDVARTKKRIVPDALHGGHVSLRVAGAVARVEGRRLITHPAFLAGLGLLAVEFVVFGRSAVDSIIIDPAMIGLMLFPPAGMAILAAAFAATRPRRDGTDELFSSLPASEESRIAGQLLSAGWAVAVAVVGVVALIAYWASRGPIALPSVADLMTGPVLVGCAVVVGVTAARLVPSPLIGIVAVFGMGVFQGAVDHFSGLGTTRTAWFAPLVTQPDQIPAGMWPRRPVSHLVYVIGLGLFAASLAFVVRRFERRALVATGVALCVIAAGGIVQSRPFTAADHRRVADPVMATGSGPHMTCRMSEGIEYCAYRDQARLMSRWTDPVSRALAPIRPVLDGRVLRLTQRVAPATVYALPAPVKALLPASAPQDPPRAWPDDGGLHPDGGWCRGSCPLSLATQAAAWAVGLPLEPVAIEWPDPWMPSELKGYASAGQARAVVALWLGAQSSPEARAAFRSGLARPVQPGEDSKFYQDAFFVRGCAGITDPGTQFGVPDALIAAALLDRPDNDVARIIRANWSRLTDPATLASEVRNLFGIPAVQADGISPVFC